VGRNKGSQTGIVVTYPMTCQNPECGREFRVVGKRAAHGSNPARYCSQACYHRATVIGGNRGQRVRESLARAKAAGKHIGPPRGRIPWNKGKECPQLAGERNGMFGRTHTPEIRALLARLASEQLSELTRQRLGGAQAPMRRSDPEYSRIFRVGWLPIRRQALERDGFACQVCDATPKRLNVHHIMPFGLILKHEMANLITLCEACHSRVHRGALALAAGDTLPVLKDVGRLGEEHVA
jgi:5-methylcytosine-specific restriction endonuclease McrA